MTKAFIAFRVFLGFAFFSIQSFSSVQAQDVLHDLRSDGNGYSKVVPGYDMVFPKDHGAHDDYRIEWWYLTANLKDQAGRDWGVHWTLFRQAMNAEPSVKPWQSNQVWMAHAAVTTPKGHFHEQRFARGGIGQAGVSDLDVDNSFNAWLDDWHWSSKTKDMFPAKLTFSVGQWEIKLQLQAEGQRVKNGVNGYSQKSALGQASYYYSQPHIKVTGLIKQAGKEQANSFKLAGGGWLDREWSSQPLAQNQTGWDWFSLHLDEGSKLMVYRLRHDNGQNWISGTWVEPAGESRALTGEAISLQSIQHKQIKMVNGDSRTLPLHWRIKIKGKTGAMTIKPLYDEQWMDTRIPYWEGVVMVEDQSGLPLGKGYMELTGY